MSLESKRLKNRLYMREWARTHPEESRERSREQYLLTKLSPKRWAKRIKARKNWMLRNKEKVKKQRREYEVALRQTNVNARIAHNLRNRLWIALDRKKAIKGGSFNELIGCEVSFLIRYLEDKFKDGMNWDLRGQIHIDHIKPLNSFNLKDSEEQRRAFHYTNLQPLWANDNIRKRDYV